MTINEFGASIKAKYPEYQKYDDAVIGQKMLEKYPQYADKITTAQEVQQPNPLDKVGGVAQVLGGIAKTVNPNIVGYAQNMLQQVGGGNLIPSASQPQDVLASVGGPGVEMLLQSVMGTPEQKQKQGAIREGALDLQTILGISGLASKTAQSGANIMEGAVKSKSVSPIKIASYLREKAAKKAGEITTKGLIEAGDEYVKLNPLAQETWEVFKPAISDKMPVDTLLKQMSTVFGNAYTKSGTVRDTAQSQLMNQLYQAGKSAIQTQAPEVAKYTGNMRQILTAPSILQKLTWLAAKLGLARGAF